ncbi:MAG TPA: hypothetical protein VG963_32905, partial [Polyangiaceae bacterium]|nr:hypothetical protein [Polyangiaceae bacterium]
QRGAATMSTASDETASAASLQGASERAAAAQTAGTPGLLAKFIRSQELAWFGPSDPRVLAICRMLLFWYVWPGFGVANYSGYAELERWAWYPAGLFEAFSIAPPSASLLALVSVVGSVSALLALVGLLYRLAAPLAAISSFILLGLPQNFGKVDHSENLLVLALLVFSFARAADAWSIDAWLRRRWSIGAWLSRRSASGTETARVRVTQPSGYYTWPRRFLLLLVVTMYGAAGASKLLHSGWAWALSDSFRWLLLRHHFTHHPPTQLGVWIANYPALCQGLALGALLTELLCPLSLLSRKFSRVLVPALFVLQGAIWLVLGVHFRAMFPVFYCLLPWPALLLLLERAGLTRMLDTFAARARPRPTPAAAKD